MSACVRTYKAVGEIRFWSSQLSIARRQLQTLAMPLRTVSVQQQHVEVGFRSRRGPPRSPRPAHSCTLYLPCPSLRQRVILRNTSDIRESAVHAVSISEMISRFIFLANITRTHELSAFNRQLTCPPPPSPAGSKPSVHHFSSTLIFLSLKKPPL